jgi:hypothetical protein
VFRTPAACHGPPSVRRILSPELARPAYSPLGVGLLPSRVTTKSVWGRAGLAGRFVRGRQQTRPVNRRNPRISYAITWASASPLGLSLNSCAVSFPTGETARLGRTCRIWRTRATVAATAAVKIMGVGIWYADSMALRLGFDSVQRQWRNCRIKARRQRPKLAAGVSLNVGCGQRRSHGWHPFSPLPAAIDL